MYSWPGTDASTGFIGCAQKRLEKGTFEIPKFDEATGGYRMPWKTFSLIMQGVSLRSARYLKRFNILAEIKDKLDGILNKPDLLPDSELSEAASYFNNEWEAVVDIFKRGDTALDNNLVERMNRYFSMSRRSSLFFGSHKGAERAAVLYTLALSAKMNNLNLFDYLADILDRTAQWQPNTPMVNYRRL